MYEPTQIIFAPTGRCNLGCAHCRVSRDRGELSVADALDFLRDCAANPAGKGIERVGFSGGEPFLRPDFLVAVSKAVVDEGLLFDRLMTNGVWYADEVGLRATLTDLRDAGFDGTVGLSVDDWHAQEPTALALFLETLFDVFGRRDMAEIVSVTDRASLPASHRLAALAALLGGRLVAEEGLPLAIVDDAFEKEEARAGGSALSLRIVLLRPSLEATEEGFGDAAWFEDDRCEGPGQALYVHPDGRVAVCCGFANERPELDIGRVQDGLAALLERAGTMPQVNACYGEGLSALRQRLEAEGHSFPGISGDQCFFCDWICARGLSDHLK